MKNKVVIITGASSGIGKACAWIFAQAGAKVVLAARNLEKINLLCVELQEAGFTALAVQTDVSKELDCQHLILEAVAAFKDVDVLINNAGVVNTSYHETSDGIENTFAVNHLGYFLFTNLLLHKLKGENETRIVNVSSTAH